MPLLPAQLIQTERDRLPLTLARLSEEFLYLADLIADTDPADVDGVARLETLLEASAVAIQVKAGSIASLIREFDARADIALGEADRIASRGRAARAQAAWLRSYLLKNLRSLDVDRVDTPIALISVRRSPPSLEIVDEDEVPEAFKHMVQTIDRGLLKAALVENLIVPGACLVRGYHLVMR
jgi:hypothetical protein